MLGFVRPILSSFNRPQSLNTSARQRARFPTELALATQTVGARRRRDSQS